MESPWHTAVGQWGCFTGGARRTSWRGCALSGLEIEAFKMCRKQGQRGLIIVQLHWHLEGIMRKRGPCVADGS